MSTPETWYVRWEADYVGSGDERKNFQQWYEARYAEGKIDPESPEEDLMNEYRDTQSWCDTFLDWAWVQEADYRIEQHTEENNQ